MKPFFSIITPTLQRDSLTRCCSSLDSQTFDSWEHLVWIDCETINYELMGKISHPQRTVISGNHACRNYGNTPRHLAWEKSSGKYLIMLDDDNYMADPRILEDIAGAFGQLSDADYQVQWAIFPILRHGSVFFNDPPGLCKTDTLNVIARRDIGQWPDIPDYTADGIWVEGLKKKAPYTAFPGFRPIGVMPYSSEGK